MVDALHVWGPVSHVQARLLGRPWVYPIGGGAAASPVWVIPVVCEAITYGFSHQIPAIARDDVGEGERVCVAPFHLSTKVDSQPRQCIAEALANCRLAYFTQLCDALLACTYEIEEEVLALCAGDPLLERCILFD